MLRNSEVGYEFFLISTQKGVNIAIYCCWFDQFLKNSR